MAPPLVILVIGYSVTAQLNSPPVPTDPGTSARPTTVIPGSRPEELLNDELISRLPPARQEKRRDTKTNRWVDDPIGSEWSRRMAAGMVNDQELGAAIRSCGMLRSSPTCFEGKPYHVWMRIPAWLPALKATAKPRLPDCRSAHAHGLDIGFLTCGNALAGQESAESLQEIGVLPHGTDQVVFDVSIQPSEYSHSGSIRWAGEITLRVELIPEAAPTPIDSPELSALVRRAANVSCANGVFGNGPTLWLSTWTRRPINGPLNWTLMWLSVELIRDGNVVATQSIKDPDEAYGMDAWGGKEFFQGEVARSVVIQKDIEHYSVRVRGVAPSETSHWYRPRYWNGEYVLPLSEVIEPECGAGPVDRAIPKERDGMSGFPGMRLDP